MSKNKLCLQLGRDPTISEISEDIGLTAEEIIEAEMATSSTESIHDGSGEDGFSLENILSNTKSEDEVVEVIALKQAIEHLSEREALVIKLRYFHGLTQQRVSTVLSVSQVQISRIEKKAISKLRSLLV